MDEVPPARRGGLSRFLVPLAAIAVVGVGLAWLVLHRIASVPLTVAGVPRINLTVAEVQRDGEPVEATPPSTGTATPADVFAQYWAKRATPTPEPAERDETFQVARVPIAVSLYVLDGDRLLAWAEDDAGARAFFDSELVKGMSQDLLRLLHVRGEDLKMPGIQGSFLEALGRDVLSANAVVHYDQSRGRRGWVLAFDRSRSSLASRLVPLIVATVGKREYRVDSPTLSIIEIWLGPQRLFVTESDGLIYLASSIGTLLNVVAAGPLPPPDDASGTVAVTMRAEAWLRDLVPAMTGADHFELTWTADLRDGAPGEIRTSAAAFFDLLQPALADAVLAAMPRDAFAVAAASVPFPHFEASDGRDRFEPDPKAENAGIAVVWDLEMTDKLHTQVGIAALARRDETTPELESLVSDKGFADRCAGDSVLLAATSEMLLTRMKEACDGQSIGILDRVAPGGDRPQIILAVDPGDALTQVLARGIGVAVSDREGQIPNGASAGDDWTSRYRAAVENARADATETLATLPSVVFQGTATRRGAILKGAFEPPRQLARRTSR